MTIATEAPLQTPAYARFSRRLQGMMIDSIVLLLIMTAALVVAVGLQSDHVGRILGFTVAATWILYEPVLVSATGSTLGHRYCNIRVVDNRTGGNVGFVKAIFRMIIKTILGWLSFLSMTIASRHQAIHDLLTGSTVQIRDLHQAKPFHFSLARNETLTTDMPSPVRRLTIIVVYELGWSVLALASIGVLHSFGALSSQCLGRNVCSPVNNLVLTVVTLGWLGVTAWLLGLGWRGRLWGARTRLPGSGDHSRLAAS